MAVRNLEAIQRSAATVAEKKSNEQKRREEFTKKRICTIQESVNDATDASDTIHEIWRSGFRCSFLDKKYLGIEYDGQFKAFYLRRHIPRGRSSDEIKVGYIPHTNKVFAGTRYGWGGYEYSEFDIADIKKATEWFYRKEGYNELLVQLADSLAPFLKAFLSWIETAF